MAIIYLGANLVAWQCQRQFLAALSSAETELSSSVRGIRIALSLNGQLSEMILSKPTCTTYCENVAVVQLTQQLPARKTRTRRLSMRTSWLHHLVKHENVSMQFAPTDHQEVNILTKGLSAYMHELARQGLRLQVVMVSEFMCIFKTSYVMIMAVDFVLKTYASTCARPIEHVACSEGLRIVLNSVPCMIKFFHFVFTSTLHCIHAWLYVQHCVHCHFKRA